MSVALNLFGGGQGLCYWERVGIHAAFSRAAAHLCAFSTYFLEFHGEPRSQIL